MVPRRTAELKIEEIEADIYNKGQLHRRYSYFPAAGGHPPTSCQLELGCWHKVRGEQLSLDAAENDRMTDATALMVSAPGCHAKQCAFLISFHLHTSPLRWTVLTLFF